MRNLQPVPSPGDDPSSWPRGSGTLREIIMGAQDNLTTVLAVVLGVAIGSGKLETIALAGMAAGIAEAVSMGGVLYTATRAERDLAARTSSRSSADRMMREPIVAGAVTFAAAVVAAAIPLAPFAVLPVRWATPTAGAVSVAALFALGTWTGRVTGGVWWRDGIRFVTIGGLAALAAALVGAALRNGAP
ncbi:MAG TPA: VIT1/CCC1 transporter family protein [Actinomycetota bacterium]